VSDFINKQLQQTDS
jgi:hypothetical protein